MFSVSGVRNSWVIFEKNLDFISSSSFSCRASFSFQAISLCMASRLSRMRISSAISAQRRMVYTINAHEVRHQGGLTVMAMVLLWLLHLPEELLAFTTRV